MSISKIIIFSLFLFFSNILITHAVTCYPAWDGNWTADQTCDYPTGGYKVFGDIYVNTRTITIPAATTLWINLTTQKITFTTGKILIPANSKIDNSVSTRFYVAVAYTNWAVTSCPGNTEVMDTTTVPVYNATTFNNLNAYLNAQVTNPGPYPWSNANVRNVASSGTMYCATRWS